MKKCLVLFTVLLLAYFAVMANAETTITVQVPDNTASLNLSDDPDSFLGEVVDTLTVGRDREGFAHIALLRMPLPAAMTSDTIESVYLRLHQSKAGAADPAFETGYVLTGWTMNGTGWADIHGSLAFDLPAGAPEALDDEWVQIDVTEIVKAWFAGSMDNNGFVFRDLSGGAVASLDSAFGENAKNAPQLIICYQPKTDAPTCGRFGYTEQAEGNCFSYALRDTSPIYYPALIADTPAFQAAHDEGGEVGALAYFKALVFAYMEENKEALALTNVRELDGFDAPIDETREYRVAMRIGFREHNAVEGIQVEDDFDYHFRLQLADGSWAEKLPGEDSRITPGSNADIDPGRYPWDESYLWGYEKWAAYFTSDTVFFAVEKDTDAFTQHLESANE